MKGGKAMSRKVFRIIAGIAVLLLAASLAGCFFVFTIVGSDTYHVNGTGLLDGPAMVEVSWTGFIPRWPDVLVITISGIVHNSSFTSDTLDDVADALSGTIYDHLEFDEFSGATEEGNPFWVTKEIAIPSFWSLLPLDAGRAQLDPIELELSDVVGEEFYEAMMDEFVLLCNDEFDALTWVELNLGGSIETSAGKVIGTLDCDFVLYGEEVP